MKIKFFVHLRPSLKEKNTICHSKIPGTVETTNPKKKVQNSVKRIAAAHPNRVADLLINPNLHRIARTVRTALEQMEMLHNPILETLQTQKTNTVKIVRREIILRLIVIKNLDLEAKLLARIPDHRAPTEKKAVLIEKESLMEIEQKVLKEKGSHPATTVTIIMRVETGNLMAIERKAARARKGNLLTKTDLSATLIRMIKSLSAINPGKQNHSAIKNLLTEKRLPSREGLKL